MIIDLDRYRHANQKQIALHLRNRPNADPLSLLSELAIITGVPIIAVCYMVGEIVGFSDNLLAKIERIKKFYRYEGVIGIIDSGCSNPAPGSG